MPDPGSNAAQVARAIRGFADSFQRATFMGLDTWARQTSNALRRQCPSKEAKATISGRAVLRSEPLAHVECVSLIGMYLEYGTGMHGPLHHMITAKGGTYVGADGIERSRHLLRWKNYYGNYVFAHSVQGMEPNPWFWKTVEAMISTVAGHIEFAVQKMLELAFGGIEGVRLMQATVPPIPQLPPVRQTKHSFVRRQERGVASARKRVLKKMAAIRARLGKR